LYAEYINNLRVGTGPHALLPTAADAIELLQVEEIESIPTYPCPIHLWNG
jgi:hypothetical protein